ncbi:MAG: large subunit ribosomal protein [Bacillota bacterium]|jgi:large subunit ribosomal protein L23|nr:large subunit ribosomal protein [Bacillota bacterium]MDK2856705.1 large subunit ribosomal protein [Bacillota bacterium]MDK2924529.1 large subunit ribosomal protein [Bacillota bacterium]
MDPRDVLKRPVITERATAQMEQGKYTFEVDPRATKIDIKNAVETIFKVDVLKVATIRVPGKARRVGRHVGHTSPWKKAIVTIKKGQRIPFFEGA